MPYFPLHHKTPAIVHVRFIRNLHHFLSFHEVKIKQLDAPARRESIEKRTSRSGRIFVQFGIVLINSVFFTPDFSRTFLTMEYLKPTAACLLPHLGGILGGFITRKNIKNWYEKVCSCTVLQWKRNCSFFFPICHIFFFYFHVGSIFVTNNKTQGSI